MLPSATQVALHCQAGKCYLRPRAEAKQPAISYAWPQRKKRLADILVNIQVRRSTSSGLLSFDEEEVRRLLGPAGLCERVLEVSDKQVRELLKDPTVPADLRRALEDCAQSGAARVRWTVSDLAPAPEDEAE